MMALVFLWFGCNTPEALNYDTLVNVNDGSCIDRVYGCMDEEAYNFNDYDGDGVFNELIVIPRIDVNTNDGSCVDKVYGCMDMAYMEYDSQANEMECQTLVYECGEALILILMQVLRMVHVITMDVWIQ